MSVDILMYHSISDSGGPTSIPEPTFASQMAALAESKIPVLSLDAAVAQDGPKRAVVITFDDAFEDFATSAWPVLSHFGFPAMVYVPTGCVGASEQWRGALDPARPIMSWTTIRTLADQGVSFGSHTVTHPDLQQLDRESLIEELAASKADMEDRLGRAVDHFAPPYGRGGGLARRCIAQNYRTSVGTRLGIAEADSDLLDLPRIEMFYFTRLPVWRQRLAGHGAPYLGLRRGLRALRDRTSHPWSRA